MSFALTVTLYFETDTTKVSSPSSMPSNPKHTPPFSRTSLLLSSRDEHYTPYLLSHTTLFAAVRTAELLGEQRAPTFSTEAADKDVVTILSNSSVLLKSFVRQSRRFQASGSVSLVIFYFKPFTKIIFSPVTSPSLLQTSPASATKKFRTSKGTHTSLS